MNRLLGTFTLLALLSPAVGVSASQAAAEYLAVLAAQSDDVHGAELYSNCVSCHEANGLGRTDGSTPRLAGQHYRVLVRQIIDFRYSKRWDFRMEEVAADRHALAQAQDIADVAAYLSGLTVDGERGIGDGALVATGATIYGGRCQSCHGIHGEGDAARAIPKIGGQHKGYLMRQMYDAVDGRRTPLAGTHRQRFSKLTFEEVRGLSDFLARTGWSNAVPPAPHRAPPSDTPDK